MTLGTRANLRLAAIGEGCVYCDAKAQLNQPSTKSETRRPKAEKKSETRKGEDPQPRNLNAMGFKKQTIRVSAADFCGDSRPELLGP
jgi:hypothetical protein